MHMGSRPYYAHIAKQYIKELWKFIQAGLSKKAPDPGNTFVVFMRLGGIGIFVHHHSAELIAKEAFPATAYPALHKKNGSA